MSTTNIKTRNLELVLQTPEETRTEIDGMTPAEKAELSADWLARIQSAISSDPWVHGFTLKQRARDAVIGRCGFKGPPTADGVVEISYGIAPDYQGNGYLITGKHVINGVRFLRLDRAYHCLADVCEVHRRDDAGPITNGHDRDLGAESAHLVASM